MYQYLTKLYFAELGTVTLLAIAAISGGIIAPALAQQTGTKTQIELLQQEFSILEGKVGTLEGKVGTLEGQDLDPRFTAIEDFLESLPGGVGDNRVFVTSGAYAPMEGGVCSPEDEGAGLCVPSDGLFNSVADADAICQAAAMSAGLAVGGSPLFLAWLSTEMTKGLSIATSPSIRFNQSPSPYFSTDGTMIADNWDDLTDGDLAAPILYNEFGVERADVGVWTGTHDDGSPTGCDCDSWSLNPEPSETCVHGFPFVTPAATIGDSTANDDFQWTEIEFSLCDAAHALYCFEQ